MNFILAIDTSSVDLSIALMHNDQPLAAFSRFVKNSHAEHISKTIESLLETVDLKASSITHAVVAVGPGSFTGLRIGVSFVKGFCFQTEIKVLPLSSLEIMAYSGVNQEGKIICAMDARRDEVFWAVFEIENKVVYRRTEDKLTSISELNASFKSDYRLFTDAVGYTKSTCFGRFQSSQNHFPLEQFPISRGLMAGLLGAYYIDMDSKWKSAEEINPNYLREFTTIEQK